MSIGITAYELRRQRNALMNARIKGADIHDVIAALEKMHEEGRSDPLMTFVRAQDLTNIGAAVVIALETMWARDVELDARIWASEQEEARKAQEVAHG